ncbi:MAG: LacI family DNA-binding transcriptional regulator [Thermaceae bacterium]|nr:LacI family DNA-binding transcriptional regulator [Thermaceae bacterium]
MATIKDVAARAGVSQSTVYYALSGKRPISQEVRQRIAAAVAELDYTASSLGQRMRAGRSYSIGMIAPQLPTSDTAAMEMLVSTAETASQADYTLGIFMGQTPSKVLRLLRNQFLDGLILVETTHVDARIEALRKTKYPFVMIGRTQNLEGLTTVDFDFEGAIFKAFEALVQLGHKTIGFVAPNATEDLNVENWFHIQRGFERARERYCFEAVVEKTRLTIEGGYTATEKLLETEPRITAIVASGNTFTGILRSLYSRRIRVPDECSLVGIATAQVAEWTIPKLTSVDIPLREMSKIATQLLLHKLAGKDIQEQIIMPAQLVVRETIAPPSAKLR